MVRLFVFNIPSPVYIKSKEKIKISYLDIRDAFKIKKRYILGLCPKVVDPLPSPPFWDKKFWTFWSAFGPIDKENKIGKDI